MELLKDRYKVGLGMAVLFFLGILFSLYTIYSLPYKLTLADGYQNELLDVYIVLGVTFFIGALTIWTSLQYRNEVIVFREKTQDKNGSDQASQQE